MDGQGQIAVLTRSVGDFQRLVEGALPDRCPSRSRTHSAREFALASCILFTWYADDDAALTMGTKGGITATSASRTWAARPAAPVPLESAAAAASWWTSTCPLAWDAACGATVPSAAGTALPRMKPNALDVNQKTRLGRRVGYLQDIDLMSERRRKRSEDDPNSKALRRWEDRGGGKGGDKGM